MPDTNPLTEFRADLPAPTSEYLSQTRTALLPAMRHRSRLRMRITVAGATAATATAGLMAFALVGADSASAADVLDKAASTAAAQPNPTMRPGQLSFIQTMECGSKVTRMEWLPPDGKGAGLIRTTGSLNGTQETKTLNHQWVGLGPGVEGAVVGNGDIATLPALFFPTYDFLLSLPTDPAALLAVVDKEASVISTDRDGEAFWIIANGATSAYIPPQVRANLFRAAALIAGTKVVKNVTDCAGRHGIAVTRTLGSGSSSGTSQLVFDADFQLLGFQSSATTRSREAEQ